MNYVCLGNSVVMMVSEKGYKLKSSAGEITRFDSKGNIIDLRYFFKMGENERVIVKDWKEKIQRKGSDRCKEFLYRVDDALERVNYDYYIATIEPSMKAKKLYYEPGNEVARCLTAEQWETKAKNYAPNLGSRLALVDELILWYAYRIAKGYWTLSYVCKDSSELNINSNGIIKKGCAKSKLSQKSKGIILDLTSAISANPLLQIDEFDVEANHGASIGAIDDEDLYYLMSRGLTKSQSEQLIVSGYMQPILSKMNDEQLQKYASFLIENKLK